MALCAVAALVLFSCVTWTPRSAPVSSSAVVLPNMSMHKWGFESCGAGALSTVLQHFGDPTSMDEWDRTLPKTRGGVMTVDLLIAARQKGFDARIVTGDPGTVEAELRAGRPVILMLQVLDFLGRGHDFFHYIVADGIDIERRLIRTQFGDGRARWVTFEKIDKPWSGGAKTAILIRPRDPLADRIREAVALEESGDLRAAAERYRALLGAHPESALAWTNLGNVSMRLGNRREAEEAFQKALAIDAAARDAMNNLAWLLFEEKRLDEAETLARRAVAAGGPDRYLVLDTLARILVAKGSCSEATAVFRDAVAAVPATRAGDLEESGRLVRTCGTG